MNTNTPAPTIKEFKAGTIRRLEPMVESLRKKKKRITLCMTMVIIFVCSFATMTVSATQKSKITLDNIPAYSDSPFVEINDNKPRFLKSQLTKSCFEKYAKLDKLARCGTAFANVSKETTPTEERGNIGMIKPSG